jgi:hypothetical protein
LDVFEASLAFSHDQQPTCSPANREGVMLLDLNRFKTQQCTVQATHNPKKCFYYHEANSKDRRRPLGTYTSTLCDNLNKCPLGDSCPRAHNTVEDFYHPEKYKSKFCQTYPNHTYACKFGEMCAFAHTEEELSIDYLHRMERDTDFYLFHFKTVWCPFSDKEDTNHPRDVCVYAHNWQDFRRKVHIYSYSKDQCTTWGNKKKTRTYADGCSLEYRCGYCHGWKE